MNVDHLVVVGASLAGLRAVETARSSGYDGRITLIGAEEHLPYDRPPLSKELLDSQRVAEVVQHRDKHEFYRLGLDLRLGQRVAGLDSGAGRIQVDGESIPYDALVIATGATPRRLPNTGTLGGVHTLRTFEDAMAIRNALDRGARTVVVGAGFIGSEVAAAARGRGLPVTLVEALPTPLMHAIGEQCGAAVSRLHEDNGAELRCGVSVTGLCGDTHVRRVELSDGSSLEAELVVVGIGAEPETGWLSSSQLSIEDGIVCDATLNAGVPGVYAAGDVARWRSQLFDRYMRVEHWTNAGEQGALAVRNALDPGSAQAYDEVPYFWSDCYGNKIQFAGIAAADEVVVVEGAFGERKFTALYRTGDRLVGALTMNNPSHSAKCQVLITKQASIEETLQRLRISARTT